MQTLDELNTAAFEAVQGQNVEKERRVGDFVVPRMTRGHSIRVFNAIAPFFSKRLDAEPEAVFDVIYDPEYQDAFMASYLKVDIEKVQEMDYETYRQVDEAFNELNPNFISDVTNEEAAKAVLRHALTQSQSA